MPDANRDVVTELEGKVLSRRISPMSDPSGEFGIRGTRRCAPGSRWAFVTGDTLGTPTTGSAP